MAYPHNRNWVSISVLVFIVQMFMYIVISRLCIWSSAYIPTCFLIFVFAFFLIECKFFVNISPSTVVISMILCVLV